MMILECYFLPLLLENIRLNALDVYTLLFLLLLCYLLGGNFWDQIDLNLE